MNNEITVISEVVTLKVGQRRVLHSSYGYDMGHGRVKITEIHGSNPDVKEIQDMIDQMVYQYTRAERGDLRKERPFEELTKEEKAAVSYWYSTSWIVVQNLEEKHVEYYGEHTYLPVDIFVDHTTVE